MLFVFMMFCINAIIPKHFKILFGDMDNQSFDEIHSRNTFFNCFIIFMSSIVKSYIIAIVFIDARSCNNRSTQVTTDVLESNIRSTGVRFGTDIETISVFSVDFVFYFLERRTELFGK